MLKKQIFIVLVLLLLPTFALAEDIIVTKSAPSHINLGDNLQVTITIANNRDTDISVEVQENIGDAQAIDPQIAPQANQNEDFIAARPPFLHWTVNVKAKSQESVTYTIKPNEAGDYLFSPTLATLSNGEVYYSNILATQVGCKQDNVCDSNLGEDYTNCPADCPLPKKENNDALLGFIIRGVGFVILVGVVILIVKLTKKRRKKRQENHEQKSEETTHHSAHASKETNSKHQMCPRCGKRLRTIHLCKAKT